MDMKNVVAQWVRSARKDAGLSQDELGAKLALELRVDRGFTKANISHWETQKHGPSLEQLLGISKITGAPLPDSITGNLSQVPPPDAVSEADLDSKTIKSLGQVRRVSVGNPSTDVIPVKLVNLHVQAGYPHFEADPIYDDHTTLDLPRQWVEENQLIPNCLLAIKVRGASMEPMLYEDETIVINIADTKLITNQIYAVNYNGVAVVKQMVYKNREWWLYSFNQDDEFRPVMARSGDCQVIGKMVYQPGRSLIGKL